jgi:hypothetical protein
MVSLIKKVIMHCREGWQRSVIGYLIVASTECKIEDHL